MELYETLKYLSSHLFVVVVDAELNNNMTSYTMAQKVSVMKTVRSAGGSWASGGQTTPSRVLFALHVPDCAADTELHPHD
jgi:hypothetical protein